MAEFALLRNKHTGAEWHGPLSYAAAHPDWSPVDSSAEVPKLNDADVSQGDTPGFTVLRNEEADVEWYGPLSYAQLNPEWSPVDSSVQAPSLAEGTIEDVMASVNGDPVLAQAALDAELASPKPRTTLVDRLSALLTS